MPWPTAGSRRVPSTHSDAVSCRSTPTRESGERAEALFGAIAGDRAKVYEAYKDVVASKPDPARGRAVFRRECAQCHRLDQEGTAVGPDLFGIRNQPKEAILLHILVPDQEITQGFTAYTVATKDGRVLTGLIASETPTAITLRQPLGKEDTIPRDQVDELSASKQSLMPQGWRKRSPARSSPTCWPTSRARRAARGERPTRTDSVQEPAPQNRPPRRHRDSRPITAPTS